MNDQSNGQKLFLTRLRRHRITVLSSRVLILTVFLFLWELCARFEIIDSFIFSSPSKITLCFLEMLKNRSLFLHIGITLYEHLSASYSSYCSASLRQSCFGIVKSYRKYWNHTSLC